MTPKQENLHINYIEFPARDLLVIKDFYSKAFGWEFIDYGPDYTAFSGAGVDGGFTTQNKIVSVGGPLVILRSYDLERTLKTVVQCGGEITEPIFDFPGGRRFHFSDPSGNVLAVWSDQ